MQISKEEIQAALEEEIKLAEQKYGKGIKFTLISIIGLIKMLNPERSEKQARLIPLADWENYHSFPSKGALRQYYFRRQTNGFDSCVEPGGENGNRILINEDKFFEWQRNRKKKGD